MNEPSHLAIMSDPLFWSLCQILFVKRRCSYFHASVVVNKEGEAVAFMGTGGAGKTSTLFKLLEEPSYKYLVDDYGMISEDGTVFFTSSMVTIYRADVGDGQGIKHKFMRKGFSAPQRLKWALISKLRRRHAWVRVSIHDLLPESQIHDAARLTRVIHLIRANIKEPRSLPISNADLVLRMLNGSLRGMNHTFEFLRLIHANSTGDQQIMTESQIQQEMSEIYRQALMNVEGQIILHPLEFTADKIVQFLKHEKLV